MRWLQKILLKYNGVCFQSSKIYHWHKAVIHQILAGDNAIAPTARYVSSYL
jgi:hypothetical protein